MGENTEHLTWFIKTRTVKETKWTCSLQWAFSKVEKWVQCFLMYFNHHFHLAVQLSCSFANFQWDKVWSFLLTVSILSILPSMITLCKCAPLHSTQKKHSDHSWPFLKKIIIPLKKLNLYVYVSVCMSSLSLFLHLPIMTWSQRREISEVTGHLFSLEEIN